MFESAWHGMGVTTLLRGPLAVALKGYLQNMMIIVLRSADCLIYRNLLVMLTMVGAVCTWFVLCSSSGLKEAIATFLGTGSHKTLISGLRNWQVRSHSIPLYMYIYMYTIYQRSTQTF